MKQFFVTGTSTGVGKTRCTALMLEWLSERGARGLGLKPVSAGDRDDAQALHQAGSFAEELSLDEINPTFYQSPVAPLVAARIEGQVAQTEALVQECKAVMGKVQADVALIEGVGGWEVPMADGKRQLDLVRELDLEVILVINNELGALNHTLLTVRALQQDGVKIAGYVLNHINDSLDLASITNKALIPELTGMTMLGEVLHNDPMLTAEPELDELFGV